MRSTLLILQAAEAAGAAGAAGSAPSAKAPTKRAKKKPKGSKSGDGADEARQRDLNDWVPNVRTANTFLRGCLVGGGLDDAEWMLSKMGRGVWKGVKPDVASCEYVGTLLAQALRLPDAIGLAERAVSYKTVKASKHGNLPAEKAEEAAAAAAGRVRLAVCRGAALVGGWKGCSAEAKAARSHFRKLRRRGPVLGSYGGEVTAPRYSSGDPKMAAYPFMVTRPCMTTRFLLFLRSLNPCRATRSLFSREV